jgi:uncharacterized protein
MIKIGQFNFLKICQKSSRGMLLFAGEFGQVFLPAAQVPSHCEVGDKIQVFLYRDIHDEVVATTKKPRVEVGGIACLKVITVNQVGAFLDWGLPKDLFAPFGEQIKKISASSKLNKFIKAESQGLETGQEVNLIVGDKSDLGFKMIVNQSYWGVLHDSDVFRELRYGQSLRGFIKNVRADKRLDITLKQPGYVQDESLEKKIVDALKANQGFSPVNDKSAPELIYKLFGVSKKVFKAEIGSLYKQRIIVIEKDGIRLNEQKN